MSGDPEVIEVVRQWVAKAESDLRTAVHTLEIERDCPTDTICFHVQQCVEKYLKALLTLRGTPFPRTHDVSMIDRLLPEEWRLDLPPELMRRLTDYGTITRYPGEYEPIGIDEARAAIRVARRVRKQLRPRFPAAGLRRSSR